MTVTLSGALAASMDGFAAVYSVANVDQTTPLLNYVSGSSIVVTNASGNLAVSLAIDNGTISGVSGCTTTVDQHTAWWDDESATSCTSSPTSTFTWTATTYNTEGASIQAAGCAAPSDASYVTANAQNGQTYVYWSSANPVVVLRKTNAVFGGETPGAPGTATTVYSGSTTPFNNTSLTNANIYYYKVFANASGCYSPGIAVNATPDTGATGHAQWSYATTATTLAPPGLDPNDVVIAGSNTNTLNGMRAADGTQAFAPFVTGGPIQAISPVIPAAYSQTGVNIAYVSSQDGFLYAVNTSTGAQVWKSPSLGTTLQGGAAVWLQAVKSLTVCGVSVDAVIVGTRNTGGGSTTNNKVYALNGKSSNVTATGSAGGGCVADSTVVVPGGILWTYSPGNMDIISSTPYVDYTNNVAWVTSRAAAGTNQPSLWKLVIQNGTAP